MAYLRFVPLAFASLSALAASASAQSLPPSYDCSVYSLWDIYDDSESFPQYQANACARAAINRQMLINNINVIPRVTANSLGIGPGNIEPAGLGGLDSGEFAKRLAGGSAIVISPVADAAPETAPSTSWNVWADGKYTWNDNGPPSFDLDGPLWNGLFGIDYKVTSKFTFGIMGSYESSDLDGNLIDLESQGWGIGPYLGVILTDNIVFSANLTGAKLDSSQFGGALDFESDRIQAAASLNGYWYRDTWRFNPGISLSWSKEWMEEDTGFLPDQIIETGLATANLQIGNTLRLSDQSTVEPWAGAAFDYTFLNKTTTKGVGSDDDPYTDLRAQFGLNFVFGTNMQLSLIGELGGLLREDTATYAGEASLAYQF